MIWTEARLLHLIEGVTTVKANSRREGKADRSSAAGRSQWDKVAAQLPYALFGELSPHQLSKSIEKQFPELLSKHRGLRKRKYKKLPVNVSVKLDEFERNFPSRISKSRALKIRAYVQRSGNSQGQSKMQELEQAPAESAESLSDVERSPSVYPMIDAARDTEDGQSSGDEAPSREDLPDDSDSLQCQSKMQELEQAPAESADDSDSLRSITHNTESATQSTKEALEHRVLNDRLKEKFLESAHEEISELKSWHREFVNRATDIGCEDNKRGTRSFRRSNDYAEAKDFKELAADCLLRKYISKFQLLCEDLKFNEIELLGKLSREIAGIDFQR